MHDDIQRLSSLLQIKFILLLFFLNYYYHYHHHHQLSSSCLIDVRQSSTVAPVSDVITTLGL